MMIIKKRDISDLYDGNYIIGPYGSSIVLDFIEKPYTKLNFICDAKQTSVELDIMKVILNKVDVKSLRLKLSSKAKQSLSYLLSMKVVVQCGINYEKDIDFSRIYCYSFIEQVENAGEFYLVTISEGFYKIMNRYFNVD
jgi:hypothetical protein